MSSSPAPQAQPGQATSGGRPDRTASDPSTTVSAPPSALNRLQQALDRLLVLDVFLVIGGALWFGLAVLLHARGIEAPLQWFQRLWEPLFTPAIGLLMAAALLSGALGWWRRRGRSADRDT